MNLSFVKRFAISQIAKNWIDRKSIFDWRPLIGADNDLWKSSLENTDSSQSYLLATSMGGYLPGQLLDGVLAAALTLRGVKVHILLCDMTLPACQLCDVYLFPNQKKFIKCGPKSLICKRCYAPALRSLEKLGVSIHKYSDFLDEKDFKAAEEAINGINLGNVGRYQIDGIAVGEHALAGALRFYAKGDLASEPLAEEVLKRYFLASLLMMYATKRALDALKIVCSSFHHGIYVPQGIVGEVCRRFGVRVVNWHVAYRKKCFIFSHDNSYHHTLISEPTDRWIELNMTESTDKRITEYLKSRWYGTKDWISFQRSSEFDTEAICRELKIDKDIPCIGMLTSVVWDAQLHYESNAFPDMMAWVFETIDYFRKRTDLQLIIRVHPAEATGMLPSRQRIANEVEERYGALPDNIILVPPESSISTYVLMSLCDSVIIYNTKTGIELTAVGIPSIVAGEAWIRNKGFSIDAESPAAYKDILDTLPLGERMTDQDIIAAKKYAYHFFFRRMIPLDFVAAGRKFYFNLNLSSISELREGQNQGLDIICDGILKGKPFVYPAEELAETL